MGQIRNGLFELHLVMLGSLTDLPGLIKHLIDPVDQFIELLERQIRGQPQIRPPDFQKFKLAAGLPDLPPVKYQNHDQNNCRGCRR